MKETILLILMNEGRVFLEKRPLEGIWGGLWSLPEMAIDENIVEYCRGCFGLELGSPAQMAMQPSDHTFTHFRLRIYPQLLRVSSLSSTPAHDAGTGIWTTFESALQAPVPTVARWPFVGPRHRPGTDRSRPARPRLRRVPAVGHRHRARSRPEPTGSRVQPPARLDRAEDGSPGPSAINGSGHQRVAPCHAGAHGAVDRVARDHLAGGHVAGDDGARHRARNDGAADDGAPHDGAADDAGANDSAADDRAADVMAKMAFGANQYNNGHQQGRQEY